jgi:hypothetical protein
MGKDDSMRLVTGRGSGRKAGVFLVQKAAQGLHIVVFVVIGGMHKFVELPHLESREGGKEPDELGICHKNDGPCFESIVDKLSNIKPYKKRILDNQIGKFFRQTPKIVIEWVREK